MQQMMVRKSTINLKEYRRNVEIEEKAEGNGKQEDWQARLSGTSLSNLKWTEVPVAVVMA